MNGDIEHIKEDAKRIGKNLTRLGAELSENQFNYKILAKNTAEYWQSRIDKFKVYHEKGIEYYTQVHSLMALVEKEKAGMFLLSISKLRQLAVKFMELLEQVRQNPDIMSQKDKQQSKWSKDLKEQLIVYSDKNLEHEMSMNANFREFYEKHLKKILE